MSTLTVYPDSQPQYGELYTDFTAIQNQLNKMGVKFERWTANCELPPMPISRQYLQLTPIP